MRGRVNTSRVYKVAGRWVGEQDPHLVVPTRTSSPELVVSTFRPEPPHPSRACVTMYE